MEDERSYWGVIPGEVLHDRTLTHAAKLLYVLLSSMAHSNGYCWPSNARLAEEMGMSKRRVVELLAMLSDRGYVRVEVRRANGTGEVERRDIYCGLFAAPRESAYPSCENSHAPPAESADPSCEISHAPPAEGCSTSCENSHEPPARNTFANKGRTYKENLQKEHTPLPPEGAGERPELFDRFWAAYPRKTNKQEALKAWQKLKPDEGLLEIMLCALEQQKRSSQWQGGQRIRFIPHPSTWLNGRRWEDETTDELPVVCAQPEGGELDGI